MPTRQHNRVRTVTVPVEERSQNLSVVLHLMLAEATPHCFPVPTSVIWHDVDPLCPEGEDLVPASKFCQSFSCFIGSKTPSAPGTACAVWSRVAYQ